MGAGLAVSETVSGADEGKSIVLPVVSRLGQAGPGTRLGRGAAFVSSVLLASSAIVIAETVPSIAPARPAAAAVPGSIQLSPFYEINEVARAPVDGFTSIGSGVSLNSMGQIAFTFKTSTYEGADVVSDVGNISYISSAFASTSTVQRRYDDVAQINDGSQVLTRVRRVESGNTTYQLYRFAPGGASWTQIATGGPTVSPVDIIGTNPTMNNSGQTAFAGACLNTTRCAQSLLTPKVEGSNQLVNFNQAQMPSLQLRPAMSDTGSVVVQDAAVGEIKLYPAGLSNPLRIACNVGCIHSGFTSVGAAPGIADAGDIVAFVGDRGNGPGVFLSVPDGFTADGSTRDLVPVTGEWWRSTSACGHPTPNDWTGIVGFDGTGMPLCFKDFDASSRIAVVQSGDSAIVTFVGTPSAPSRDNPFSPGHPLFFTGQRGIFSVEVELGHQLMAPLHNNSYIARSPMKVAQVGDVVNGRTITAIDALNDPLAVPLTDAAGDSRVAQSGDHRIAFKVSTSGGDLLLKASHLDSDQDGLLDHWERSGGGLDIDGDGVIDLALYQLNARPDQKDLFLEVDWLADDHRFGSLPISRKPEPGVADKLVAMFANAGVTLHLDAGPDNDRLNQPLSRNMGTLLEGGDEIGLPGDPATPPDLIVRGSPASPAQSIGGLKLRSLDEVKLQYFGAASNWARELVFHYAVIGGPTGYLSADRTPTIGRSGAPVALAGAVGSATAGTGPSTLGMVGAAIATVPSQPGSTQPPQPIDFGGDIVQITGSCAEAGERRTIASNTSTTLTIVGKWAGQPPAGCGFVVLDGSSGLSEASAKPAPDNNFLPGNDLVVGFEAWSYKGEPVDSFLQWRTIAHEIGHNLGLRHCGYELNDTVQKDSPVCTATAYPSLMNYKHQTVRGSSVDSYSHGAVGFDDWGYAKYDFANAEYNVGNSFSTVGLFGDSSGGVSVEPSDGFTVSDYDAGNPELDVDPPSVVLVNPTDGSSVGPDTTISVEFDATDVSGLAEAHAEFDTNGDGTPEALPATSVGGRYRASVGISGPVGTRQLFVVGTDTNGNVGFDYASVTVGGGGSGGVPAAPTAAAATSAASNVRLTWTDNASNETSFEIQRARWNSSSWGEWTSFTAAADATSFTDAAVPDGQYAYLVRATNSAGSSDWATAVIVHTTATGAPAAPTNLVASSVGGAVSLHWTDNATNELGYDVMRARWVAGVWSEWTSWAADINATTFTDNVPDGFYAYLVRAHNLVGSSDWAIAVVEPTRTTTPPAPPTNLSLSSSGSDVALRWFDNSSDEHLFDVERARYHPTTNTWSDWTAWPSDRDTTSFVDHGVADGQYAYLVRARNPNGSSNWVIQTIAHTTTATPPTAPTGLSATVAGTGVALSWTDTATGEFAFDVQRARWNGTAWADWTSWALDPDTTSFADRNLSVGRYAYLIRTTSPNGSSAWAVVEAVVA